MVIHAPPLSSGDHCLNLEGVFGWALIEYGCWYCQLYLACGWVDPLHAGIYIHQWWSKLMISNIAFELLGRTTRLNESCYSSLLGNHQLPT